jgi:hypothetical protein
MRWIAQLCHALVNRGVLRRQMTVEMVEEEVTPLLKKRQSGSLQEERWTQWPQLLLVGLRKCIVCMYASMHVCMYVSMSARQCVCAMSGTAMMGCM